MGIDVSGLWYKDDPLASYPDIIGVNKSGHNTDIDASEEDVWEQGGAYSWSATGVALKISSSNASDTAVVITIEGLNGNGVVQTQTVTLAGQTKTAIAGTWLRVNKAYNSSAVDLVGTVYIYEDDTPTDGVPTQVKIRAIISPTIQQTSQAIYTVPKGYVAKLVGFNGSINKGNNPTGGVDLKLYVRVIGKVWRMEFYGGLYANGNSTMNNVFTIPREFAELTDIKVTAKGSVADFDVSAGFDLILIPD